MKTKIYFLLKIVLESKRSLSINYILFINQNADFKFLYGF